MQWSLASRVASCPPRHVADRPPGQSVLPPRGGQAGSPQLGLACVRRSWTAPGELSKVAGTGQAQLSPARRYRTPGQHPGSRTVGREHLGTMPRDHRSPVPQATRHALPRRPDRERQRSLHALLQAEPFTRCASFNGHCATAYAPSADSSYQRRNRSYAGMPSNGSSMNPSSGSMLPTGSGWPSYTSPALTRSSGQNLWTSLPAERMTPTGLRPTDRSRLAPRRFPSLGVPHVRNQPQAGSTTLSSCPATRSSCHR